LRAAGCARGANACGQVNREGTSAILGWRAWRSVLLRLRHLEDCAMRATVSSQAARNRLTTRQKKWGNLRVRFIFHGGALSIEPDPIFGPNCATLELRTELPSLRHEDSSGPRSALSQVSVKTGVNPYRPGRT